ncbi:TRAP transporter large permease [Pseudomonas sp. AOB-7]|jgi:tripartite ATP-independent transporter DctM subunit|uniref:TRAP transporter large permease n=1 Tax=Pseudomonas sp. AOB-7 TaxID=2482750 RepID=UPI000EFB8C3A|nr:TRAP transporter large permease [Pseudomonas sp. AOB-7]RMH85055.1 TRAP transporter large permease [Pseudomonas sp. AOB-7]
MTPIEIGLLAIALMLVAIYLGMHIGIALIMISFGCVAVLRDPEIATRMVGAAVNDSISDYLFGVVPLFVLMGMLVAICGVGKDSFDVAEWLLRRIRGGLGMATVGSNATFAAITGVSIASAAVFTKIAVPEMMRHGHTARFSVGVVAASSILGMLIPPSLLLIVYGVLAEESIGKLFIAGLIPGLLLTFLFCLLIVLMTRYWPSFVGQSQVAEGLRNTETVASASKKALPIATLILLVLGGLYSGVFTPIEAGAVGALGAFCLALARRRLTLAKFWQVLVETGHVSVAVLFLIMAASLYSRMLAMTGLPGGIAELMSGHALGPYQFLLMYIAVLLILGCILDSVSILLILVPIALPIAQAFGMDPIWFGLITVVAVEIGLITPPFGISVYTVKAALDDRSISIKDIFIGVLPFIGCMFLLLALMIAIPGISTALVR